MQPPGHHADLFGYVVNVFHLDSLCHRNGSRRTHDGVFRRIMVHETQLQMVGDNVELVGWQRRPNALRHLHAAQIGKLRIALPILVETRPHDTEIERRIMRDHRRVPKILDELIHHFRKFWRVFNVIRLDAVNSDIKRRKPHIPGADQPLFHAHDPAIFDPRQPHGTGTTPFLIGCLEIDGDGFQR